MNRTIYNPATGQIIGVITAVDTDSLNSNTRNKSYINGSYDGNNYYIDSNLPVAKPANPSTNILKYDFDYTSKAFVLNNTVSNQKARNKRNELLNTIDKINPIWYSTLTEQQKNDLIAYRQALLNVPQQQGFPITIMWPTKPEWL